MTTLNLSATNCHGGSRRAWWYRSRLGNPNLVREDHYTEARKGASHDESALKGHQKQKVHIDYTECIIVKCHHKKNNLKNTIKIKLLLEFN